jgi:hypothetical protein
MFHPRHMALDAKFSQKVQMFEPALFSKITGWSRVETYAALHTARAKTRAAGKT